MTVDMNVTPIKLADPMEQYGNWLKNNYLKSEIDKAKQSSLENAGANASWNALGALDANGNANFGVVKNAMIQNKVGRLIPALEMDQQKAAVDQAGAYKNRQEGAKFNSEAVDQEMKNFATGLADVSSDVTRGPLQYYQKLQHAFTPGTVLGDHLMGQGQTLAGAVGDMKQAADGGQESWNAWMAKHALGVKDASEQSISTTNLGGHTVTQATPKYALPGTVPTTSTLTDNAETMSPDQRAQLYIKGQELELAQARLRGEMGIKAQELELKRQEADPAYKARVAGAVNLTKGLTDDFASQHIAANKIPQSVRHIDDNLALLDSNKAITGKGQDKLLGINKLLQFAHMKPVGDLETVNTELLNKGLNKIVLEQLQDGPTSMRTTNMLNKLTAESSAGIVMDPASIRSVLMSKRRDYQEQMQRHIDQYGQLGGSDLAGQMSRLGFKAPDQIPEYGIPQDKIDHLRQLPNMTPAIMSAFDKAYNQPGAAARILSNSNGGTSTGGTPFTPNVERWRPLVTKIAKLDGVDPDLVMHIMTKESGGNPSATGTNSDGSTDVGLMQVNSIHGFTPQQLKDPSFNIRQGIGILAGSLKNHPGNLRAGIKGYNGSGPAADAYAADILSRYGGK